MKRSDYEPLRENAQSFNQISPPYADDGFYDLTDADCELEKLGATFPVDAPETES